MYLFPLSEFLFPSGAMVGGPVFGVRFPEPGKEGHVPPWPGWKWGKGLVLWEDRGRVPWKGRLSIHGHVPP